MKRLVSIIVPVYNEAAGIKKFLDEELSKTLERISEYRFEVIIVDDGSKDETLEKIRESELSKKMLVRVVAFSRNFGKEVALSAGIKEAQGEAMIMIDGDGQHPVSTIVEMLKKWEEGFEIVTAVRGENTTKHSLGSKLYYMMLKMTGVKAVEGAMDFRLIDRVVADEFNKFTERNRLSRGLIDWLGFSQAYIKVQTKARLGGKPTYNKRKLAALAFDSMASMSRTPLVIFGYIGAGITVFSLILGIFVLIEQYILGDPMKLDWSGAVAMSIFVAFLVGIVLISQAMTALYVSQIHTEAKGRPLYIIDKKKSFSGCGKLVEKDDENVEKSVGKSEEN